MGRLGRLTALLFATMLLMSGGAGVALAQQPGDIELDTPFRGLDIDHGADRVDLDVVLYNRTDERTVVRFVLEDVPEGWDIAVWNTLFRYRITDFALQPTADAPDRLQQARLRIAPPPAAQRQAGEYSFTLRVTSPDGSVEYDNATYRVRVREPREVEVGTISTRIDIPVLQGAPGSTLAFEFVVFNNTGEQASFRLSAEPPPGWLVTFREAFGERRVIGGVSVADGRNERVRADVRVPLGASLGEYEIPVTVSGEGGQAIETLRANVVGRGELRASTQNQLVSLEARAGGTGVANMVLTNLGTAALEDVRLTGEAPANWVIDFDLADETVASLPAGQNVVVPVRISPPADAISGDYMVTVRANNPAATTSMNLRVTVTQSTIWGWLGIALVVLVVGGTVGLFVKLGRR